MEIKILVDYNKKEDLQNFIKVCEQHGFNVTREGGGNLPNWSGWYAELKGEREQKEAEQQGNCNLPHVSGSVLSINLHEYGYSCGDGCCYNYGTITTVNKTELPCHNQDAGTILKQVLEHLGYCVEITYSDDVS